MALGGNTWKLQMIIATVLLSALAAEMNSRCLTPVAVMKGRMKMAHMMKEFVFDAALRAMLRCPHGISLTKGVNSQG
jgi:hypothetical protein